MAALQLNITDNSNVGVACLNRNGLHLNGPDKGKFPTNLINKIKSLKRKESWRGKDSLRNKFIKFGRNDKVFPCVRQGIKNTKHFLTDFTNGIWYLLQNKCYYLNKARCSTPNRLIVTHINISLLRNKFEMCKVIIENNIDILLVS